MIPQDHVCVKGQFRENIESTYIGLDEHDTQHVLTNVHYRPICCLTVHVLRNSCFWIAIYRRYGAVIVADKGKYRGLAGENRFRGLRL